MSEPMQDVDEIIQAIADANGWVLGPKVTFFDNAIVPANAVVRSVEVTIIEDQMPLVDIDYTNDGEVFVWRQQ